MSRSPALGFKKPSDLDGRIVALFERTLVEGGGLKKWIQDLSSKSNPTVRDRLCLALYRHQLSFREPQLPGAASLTGASLWEYWASHPTEYREHCQLENEILSYLESPEMQHKRAISQKLAMLELIQQDSLTFLAYYPIVEKMFGKLEKKLGPGRRTTRRISAVQALQFRIDQGWSLSRITREVCDCGQATHKPECQQKVRQSIISLTRLLHKCGIELSKT